MATYLYFYCNTKLGMKRTIELAKEETVDLGFIPISVFIKTKEIGYEATAKVEIESNIINCSPHDIDILDITNEISFKYEPSDLQLFVKQKIERIDIREGITIFKEELSNVECHNDKGQLANMKGIIVSRLTAETMARDKSWENYDIYCPGKPIRDSEGKIIGCEGLIQIQKGVNND